MANFAEPQVLTLVNELDYAATHAQGNGAKFEVATDDYADFARWSSRS